VVDNINEWQHSAMYAAFLLSGLVDLVGFYAPRGTLPAGSEQVCSVTTKPPLCMTSQPTASILLVQVVQNIEQKRCCSRK
jgi:hypothetical protein